MPASLDRAVLDDDLRVRLVDRVMIRDSVTKQDAIRTVNALRPHDLVRLEMETLDHEQPAFTSHYDPYARN